MKIGVLGTGMVGNTLATKLVQVGHDVTMGSRDAKSPAAQEWLRSVHREPKSGSFADAAAFGEIVLNCTNGAFRCRRFGLLAPKASVVRYSSMSPIRSSSAKAPRQLSPSATPIRSANRSSASFRGPGSSRHSTP